MSIKLIALDMDGTTLDNNHITISAKNRKAISNAISNGIIVVPATGRTLYELPNSIKKITGIRFAITSNGAFTVDLQNNEKIHANPIPLKTSLRVLKIIEECRVYAEVYYRGKAYTERGTTSKILNRSLAFKFYSLFSKRVKVDSLAEFVSNNGNPIEKIELLPDDIFQKEKLEKKLREMPLSVTTSGMNSIEITNQGTSKGEALAYLCQCLQVEAGEVMAIGDNLNDLEMLNWVGLAVAVANADPIVKNVADFVTLGSNHSGVAYAIARFVK
jgi:Cof subfamily protein (haloacid dehalogenase superfamily)